MKKTVTIDGQKYILASSLLAEERLRVLKHEETFAVFDCYGDIYNTTQGEEGLYFEGTRFLSHLEFSFNKARPLLLNSTITDDNLLLTVDLTNPDFITNGQELIPRGSIYLCRFIFLFENSCYEQLTISNFSGKHIAFPINYHFQADFADIFEIRGMNRVSRGELDETICTNEGLILSYTGLDQIKRLTQVVLTPNTWQKYSNGTIAHDICLKPNDTQTFHISYHCEQIDNSNQFLKTNKSQFSYVFKQMEQSLENWRTNFCQIQTSHEQFNHWINRSYSDLFMMTARTKHGIYPYAGVPWFSAPFGRDGIITAMQTLWVNPEIAKGVLSFLAATQASELIPTSDAEPGKILHEARKGEMAHLGEIPFAHYYGSVDATPLFVVLAGLYFRSTGNLAFIQTIWPNIENALYWIDTYGDLDQDGFIEYACKSPNGLANQGWKDSADSVYHQNGLDAQAPIALCEVQGYVYQARSLASEMALALGKTQLSSQLAEKALFIKNKFNQYFWREELGMYALALDKNKKPCDIRSSNAGHCLFSEIASKEQADRIADLLVSDQFFSGWGIRTIAKNQTRYNPMSYHNGSIWPHDCSIIAMGLSKYGKKQAALKVFSAIFNASLFFDLYRLPELFCGFTRLNGRAPVHYPMSCAPQSWSAGASFFLLQACLGMEIDGIRSRLTFSSPVLPDSFHLLQIFGLKVGESSVDLEFIRHRNGDIGIHQLQEKGEVEIHIIK